MSRFEVDPIIEALRPIVSRRRRDRLAVAAVVAIMRDSIPETLARLELAAECLPRPTEFDGRKGKDRRKRELAEDAHNLIEQLRNDLGRVKV